MHIGTILLLGLATNLDNLCVGFSYGLAGKRITWPQNLLVSMISGLFAFFACIAAYVLSQVYKNIALIVGAALLIGIGLYTVIASLRKGNGDEEQKAARAAGFLDVLLLGVVLGLNCLAASFGAGLSGVEPLWVAVSVFCFSTLSIALGNLYGARLKWLAGCRFLDIASGLMLILVGVWEILI